MTEIELYAPYFVQNVNILRLAEPLLNWKMVVSGPESFWKKASSVPREKLCLYALNTIDGFL